MRTQQQYTESITLLAGVVAERAGLPADDFAARVLAGAVIGVALAATRDGVTVGDGASYYEDFDRALVLLQAGLPLGPPAG
jgi:hypothetical protein